MTWVLDLARQRAADSDSPPLFGVIVYTDRHANLKKLLRDEDYWSALDEISGPKWAVFSVRAQPGQWSGPSFPPGTVGMMHMVWKEPAANRELVSAFELNDTNDLPAVVVFALDGDTLYRASARIDESTLDAAYSSLKSVFAEVTRALETVPDGLCDPAAIFAAVKASLRTQRNWQRVGDAYRVLKELRDWLPL